MFRNAMFLYSDCTRSKGGACTKLIDNYCISCESKGNHCRNEVFIKPCQFSLISGRQCVFSRLSQISRASSRNKTHEERARQTNSQTLSSMRKRIVDQSVDEKKKRWERREKTKAHFESTSNRIVEDVRGFQTALDLWGGRMGFTHTCSVLFPEISR